MDFEWDVGKANANWQKHGVTVEETATAFADPLAAIFPDIDHSAEEFREILVGYSTGSRLLVVSFMA